MGRLLRRKKTVNVKRQRDEESGEPTPASQEQLPDEVKTAETTAPAEKKRIAPLQKKAAPSPPKEGWVQTALQFLREVRAELKKVTWPSRKQAIGSTIVVIVLVFVISVFLGMVDMALSSLLQMVTR